MLGRFQCPNCGERGWVFSDPPTLVSLCLRCGHPVEVEPAVLERPARERPAIDDAIVSWLSEAPRPRTVKNDGIASCVSCGFEGLMQYDSDRGDTICPACLTVYRMRPDRGQQVIDCPNCRRPIGVFESDRGKTIVCPNCNYFLGCVLRAEKRRFGAFPFLNAMLGMARD